MNGLLGKVREFLDAQAIRETGLVVAVSGGPDSVALLRALAMLRDEFALRPLVVAHLNHRLRGAESDADEAFVQDLTTPLAAGGRSDILWRGTARGLPDAARRGEGLESAARALRYQWLAEIAQECRAAWVATGHTADDQAETVLHRILRGTGVRGLAGIPPRRHLSAEVQVIRPLLKVHRREVAEFLAELHQPCRQDRSNADLRFTRNRIRRELLPLLEHDFNPAIVDSLCRLALQARALQSHVESRAARLLRRAELPRAGRLLILDSAAVIGVARHRLREMFRLLWRREGWPEQRMGFREWERLACMARDEAAAVDLPGRIRARRHGKVIQLGPLAAFAQD